jgi:hypothetical protein
MITYQIACTVGTTDPDAKLGLEIWVDNNKLYTNEHVTESAIPLQFDLEEDEEGHELRFVMTGKTAADTKIDDQGNIIKDACLTVTNVAFEEIELKQLFADNAVYTHDFNGSQSETQDKFYSTMGCNGIVSLEFTTPIYLWLLEKM